MKRKRTIKLYKNKQRGSHARARTLQQLLSARLARNECVHAVGPSGTGDCRGGRREEDGRRAKEVSRRGAEAQDTEVGKGGESEAGASAVILCRVRDVNVDIRAVPRPVEVEGVSI